MTTAVQPAPPVIPDSARLRYRLMSSADAQLWFELDQDAEVMRYLNDCKPSTWEEITRYFVPRVEAFTNVALGHGLWEVADKHSGEHLGWIMVREYGTDTTYHAPDNLELGWRLKRKVWGQGIATEAAFAIMQVLSARETVRVFSAIAAEANVGSTNVMKKLGMQFVDHRSHKTPLRDFEVVYYERVSPYNSPNDESHSYG